MHCRATEETSVKTNLTRQRGWSQRGERLVMDAPFGPWGTQTFVAGLGAMALLAPWVINGAMDGEAFAAYVSQVLVPALEPRTVVILDNLVTHTRTLQPPKPCAKPDAGSFLAENRPLDAFLFPQTPAAIQPRPAPH